MFAIRLKDVLRVMHYYYYEDTYDISWKLLKNSIQDAPLPIFWSQGHYAQFATGPFPFAKTCMNDGESQQCLLEWEEIPGHSKKPFKCVLFDTRALEMAKSEVDSEKENPIQAYKTVLINRGDERVCLYDELINRTWKGFRVLPRDDCIFSDSDTEFEDDESVNGEFIEEQHLCYGCGEPVTNGSQMCSSCSRSGGWGNDG